MQDVRVRIDTSIITIGRSIRTVIDTRPAGALLRPAGTHVAGHSAIVGIGFQVETRIADFGESRRTIAHAIEAEGTINRTLRAAHAAIARVVFQVAAKITTPTRSQSGIRPAAAHSIRANAESHVAIIAASAAIHRIRRRIDTHAPAHVGSGSTRALTRNANSS